MFQFELFSFYGKYNGMLNNYVDRAMLFVFCVAVLSSSSQSQGFYSLFFSAVRRLLDIKFEFICRI